MALELVSGAGFGGNRAECQTRPIAALPGANRRQVRPKSSNNFIKLKPERPKLHSNYFVERRDLQVSRVVPHLGVWGAAAPQGYTAAAPLEIRTPHSLRPI